MDYNLDYGGLGAGGWDDEFFHHSAPDDVPGDARDPGGPT